MNSVKFAKKGHNVQIFSPSTFIKPEMFHLNNNIIISEYSYINGGLGTYIGNHVHIAAQSCISGGGYCVLEDFSGISAGCRLITGSALVDGDGLTSPTLPDKYQAVERSYVILKKHALLATNVIVHPGVVIEEGTVVASGSVVTKNTECWAIYMGVPARKVRLREAETIKVLEKSVYEDQDLAPSDFGKIISRILSEK